MSGRARALGAALVLAAVFAAGLLGGLVSARQDHEAGGHGHGEGGHEEGHEEGHAAPRTLGARALANLGVEAGEARLGDWVQHVEVPATVERLPGSDRPVHAPVAGTVRAVAVRPGQPVREGDVLVELLREAFPPATLALTEAIVKPLNEEHHEAAVRVRSTALELELARAAQERLLALAGPAPDPAMARAVREGDATLRRARLALENAAHEAERHGMTEAQVRLLVAGEAEVPVPDARDVQRVLERNRLWSPEAQQLLALLPAGVRELPHSVAVLGELAGTGRLTPALVAAVSGTPGLGERLLDVAGLLQAGLTPEALVALARAGALEPVVRVQAPAGPPTGLDVGSLEVRPGQRVAAGERLLLLHDEATAGLLLAPAPSDLAALESVLASGAPLEAVPLVRGAGPSLRAVRLLRVGAEAREGLRVVAHAQVANTPLPGQDPGQRSWALRPGARYGVRVPLRTLPGRFVLPADAIAYRATEAVVLLVDGSAFRPVAVRLEHHDAEVAVVAADGALVPGDQVVLRGAPALAIALLANEGGDAGHGHEH
ncbi:MAG: biotin/lipoyl-binding protein [Planctomycetia bacterium]